MAAREDGNPSAETETWSPVWSFKHLRLLSDWGGRDVGLLPNSWSLTQWHCQEPQGNFGRETQRNTKRERERELSVCRRVYTYLSQTLFQQWECRGSLFTQFLFYMPSCVLYLCVCWKLPWITSEPLRCHRSESGKCPDTVKHTRSTEDEDVGHLKPEPRAPCVCVYVHSSSSILSLFVFSVYKNIHVSFHFLLLK